MQAIRAILLSFLIVAPGTAQEASPPPPDHPEVYYSYFRNLAGLSARMRIKEAAGRKSNARNQAAAAIAGLRESDLPRAREIAEKVVRDLDNNTKARRDALARNPRLASIEEKRFTANRFGRGRYS